MAANRGRNPTPLPLLILRPPAIAWAAAGDAEHQLAQVQGRRVERRGRRLRLPDGAKRGAHVRLDGCALRGVHPHHRDAKAGANRPVVGGGRHPAADERSHHASEIG